MYPFLYYLNMFGHAEMCKKQKAIPVPFFCFVRNKECGTHAREVVIIFIKMYKRLKF